jgi:membrane-associated phospholipid phosphatase
MQIWWRLTSFGDSTILLPCAILGGLWLLMVPATRRTGWLWLGLVVLGAAVVALSKVAFLAWNVYPPAMNFTGLSGDCALAFLCWPVAGAFLAARSRTDWRTRLIAIGMLLGVIIAVSRVLLRAHTIIEVLLGSVWGILLAAAFLWLTRRRPLAIPGGAAWVPLAALALLLIVYGHGHSFNRVLGWAALRVSGHTSVYRRGEAPSPDNRRDRFYGGLPKPLCGARPLPAGYGLVVFAYHADSRLPNPRGLIATEGGAEDTVVLFNGCESGCNRKTSFQ